MRILFFYLKKDKEKCMSELVSEVAQQVCDTAMIISQHVRQGVIYL